MESKTEDLKKLLHESIENVEDEELLLVVKEILERKYRPSEQVQLTDYQKQRIEQAKASLNNGDFLTDEDADRLVSEWLNK